MGGTAAHGNTYPQPPSASVLTLRPTTPKPDKSVALNILRAGGVGNVSEAVYTNALSLDRLLAYGQQMSEN